MKPQQPAIFHCMVLSSVEYIRILQMRRLKSQLIMYFNLLLILRRGFFIFQIRKDDWVNKLINLVKEVVFYARGCSFAGSFIRPKD